MVAVSTYSWEELASPAFADPQRQAFRVAVASVVSTARAKLPAELHGRLEKGMALVLAGDVTLQAEGRALVGSQSEGATQYALAPGLCPCKGFSTAPQGLCSHRLAAAIARRAQALMHGEGVEDAPAPPIEPAAQAPLALPEAPASANCHVTIGGRQVQVTLRDSDETRLLARLTALLAQYPVAQMPATLPSAPAQQPTPEGFCLIHQVQMPLNANARGKWYSHKREDGSWCKGK